MSMLCSFYRLNEEQTRSLLATPDLVDDLLGNTPLPPKRSFLSMVFGKSKNDPPQRHKVDPVAASETFELDQAWHILHYLFSGCDAEGDWPSAFIMNGGQEVGKNHGYGPARLLTTELSKDVADFLATQSLRALDRAYDAQQIEGAAIYWHVASEPADRPRQIEELWDLVVSMRSFFAETVQLRGSMLVHIY